MLQLSSLYEKIRNTERLLPEEGMFLLQRGELLELGELAKEIRFKKNPNNAVAFVVDTNPNYTNVCNIDYIFCAFYRHPGEKGEYTYTVVQGPCSVQP